MTDAGLHVVALQIRPQLAAHVVRGDRLTDGADVVALALDRQQHGAANGARVDALPVPFELAERQRVFLEDEPHRFQIELRGEVEHGEIFVVKRLGDRRLLQFAVGEILIQ
jgi:hypothetical protein